MEDQVESTTKTISESMGVRGAGCGVRGAGCGVRSDTLSFIAESLDNVFAALNIMVDKVPACKDFARDLFQDNNSEFSLLYFNLRKLL